MAIKTSLGVKRYNNRMDKIWARAKELERKKEELQNADHPARQFAISLIENVLEPTLGKYFRGEKYYQLEDAITMRVAEILK